MWMRVGIKLGSLTAKGRGTREKRCVKSEKDAGESRGELRVEVDKSRERKNGWD